MKDIVDKIEDIKQSIKNIEDNVIGVKELAKQVGSLPIYSIPDCGINSINEEGLYKSESGVIILVTSKEIEDTIEFTQYKFGNSIEKRVGNVPKNSNLTPKYPKEWIDVVGHMNIDINKLKSDLIIINNRLSYVRKSIDISTPIQSCTYIDIYSNYYYIFENKESKISINLLGTNNGIENAIIDTFEFEFHVNPVYPIPPEVTINKKIKWAQDSFPPFYPGKIYQINIQNGLGVWVEFNQ